MAISLRVNDDGHLLDVAVAATFVRVWAGLIAGIDFENKHPKRCPPFHL
jgi:hypothetical protein